MNISIWVCEDNENLENRSTKNVVGQRLKLRWTKGEMMAHGEKLAECEGWIGGYGIYI